MQNVVIHMCEKFHYDRLRNDRALGNLKSDDNKKNNVRSTWRPVSRSKNCHVRDRLEFHSYYTETGEATGGCGKSNKKRSGAENEKRVHCRARLAGQSQSCSHYRQSECGFGHLRTEHESTL